MTAKTAVRDIFPEFNGPFEGKRLPYMYLDSAEPLGFVTCGTGNLIDPISAAYSLAWKRPDGKLATRSEIASCWLAVKARQDMKKGGGVAYSKLKANNLRIDGAEMTRLFFQRMDQDSKLLAERFPEYDSWPADAQLAVHSMAWAIGASWSERKWPKFTAAVRAQDWKTCAKECDISTIPESNGRDPANRKLFMNAAWIARQSGVCADELVWPVSAPVT